MARKKVHSFHFEQPANRVVVAFASGGVRFNVTKLPGCCGYAVVYDVVFSPSAPPRTVNGHKKLNTALYKDFNKHLKSCRTPFELSRCKVLMTDSVRDTKQRWPSIYEFCTEMGWEKDTPQVNAKTRNKVQAFVLNRKVQAGINI